MPAVIRKRALSEDERSTITNGLRVAAERFDEHVKSISMERCTACLDRAGIDGIGNKCKRCNGKGYIPQPQPQLRMLAEQFERQAKESRDLAALIEDSESMTVAHDGR